MASWTEILTSAQLETILPDVYHLLSNVVPYTSGGTPYLVLGIYDSGASPGTLTFATTQATPTSATTPIVSGPAAQSVNSAGANPGLAGALASYNGYLIGIVSLSSTATWVSAVPISGGTISTTVTNVSFNTGYVVQGTLLIGIDGFAYMVSGIVGDVATFVVFNLSTPAAPTYVGTTSVTLPTSSGFTQFATDGLYMYTATQANTAGGSTVWASAPMSGGAVGAMTPQPSIPVNITGPIGFVGSNIYIMQLESGTYQTTAGVVYSAPVVNGTIGTWAGPITTNPYSIAHSTVVFGNSGAYATYDSSNTAALLSGYQLASAPSAPSLVSPSNASYIDASAGVTFGGIANSTDGANINARAMRLKLSTAASYTYWNANTSAFQSTIVWNTVNIAPGATGTFGPISGLSDGTTINWSMADQEASANLQGPFATDFTANLQGAVNLTLLQPTGTQTGTSSPLLEYTATPGVGASIIGGQWLVYPLSVTQQAGFAINIGTGLIPAGYLSNVLWNANPLLVAMQSGVSLSNGQTYVAYAAVQETGAEWSSTLSSTFTMALDPPATPTLTAVGSTDPTTGYPLITLTVQGHDNLLTATDASFENGIGTWIIE